MDNSVIHRMCAAQAHLIDLFLFKGAPVNNDSTRQVEILVNHGYVVGYSSDRLQPLWSAYRVAGSPDGVDYDRPHLYYADERLDESYRVEPHTFGRIDGVQLNVGHMTPNEVVNRQFGRLAQLETFFMSNMSPQYGSLNSGVWLKLENTIRNIEDVPRQNDHMWVIAGPIFGSSPPTVSRSNGQEVPVPEAYYCVTVDPYRYPWDQDRNVDIVSFRIPQDAPSATELDDYIEDIDVIEAQTQLTFFPGFGASVPVGPLVRPLSPGTPRPVSLTSPWRRHRILKQLDD